MQKSNPENWSETTLSDAGTYKVRLNVAAGTANAAGIVTDNSWTSTIGVTPLAVKTPPTSSTITYGQYQPSETAEKPHSYR